MIIIFVGFIAYIGVDKVSNMISSSVDSGEGYDQLAVLKSDYSSLEIQYESVKTEIYQGSNTDMKKKYVTAELELIKAQSDINDVESALSSNQPASEVQSRIEIAKSQLQIAKQSLSDLRDMINSGN
jgi:hypothetical protein